MLAQWVSAFWGILKETSPFLLVGLLIAGMLHVLIPPRVVLWALGKPGWRGAIRGSLLGLPLPLCSCGVVPTALALRRQGASLAAIASFTIATPETSLDALALTAALLPPIFLGIRPLAALCLAILVGTLVEVLGGSAARPSQVLRDESGICRVCGLLPEPESEHNHGAAMRVRAILGYAFGDFFRDIANWLLLGLALAAAIEIAMPDGWLALQVPASELQVLLAIVAGIPLYSCATATTPLAAVLLAKGLSPGAALALLLAGPATNIGTVLAYGRELGLRAAGVYYGSLVVLCWAAGTLVNRLPGEVFTRLGVSSPGQAVLPAHLPGWLETASAVAILVLAARLWIPGLVRSRSKSHSGHTH